MTAVFGLEETSGHRATPEHTRTIAAAGLESPDQAQRPVDGFPAEGHFRNVAFRHRRIHRRPDFGPRGATIVRAMQLHAEVAVIERGKEGIVSRIVYGQRAIVSEKTDA